MKTSELIVQTGLLLADPEKWTRHAYARDAEGVQKKASSPDAVCFCMVGAMKYITGAATDDVLLQKFPVLRPYFEADSDQYIFYANDNASHAGMMLYLSDLASTLAKDEQ